MGDPDKPLTRFDEDENPADLTEKDWRDRLTPDQFYVCRQRGTESAYVGRYVKFDKKGTYHCMACDAFLFKSEHKYPSNCGWPSFYAARTGDVKSRPGQSIEDDPGLETVKRREDNSLGMNRVEVSCRTCNSHLGHVFPDGPLPTRERFCINSMAINFHKPSLPHSKKINDNFVNNKAETLYNKAETQPLSLSSSATTNCLSGKSGCSPLATQCRPHDEQDEAPVRIGCRTVASCLSEPSK